MPLSLEAVDRGCSKYLRQNRLRQIPRRLRQMPRRIVIEHPLHVRPAEIVGFE
jgi:hypothetical protein